MPLPKNVRNYTGFLMGTYRARVKPSELVSDEMNRSNADPRKTARHMNTVFSYYYALMNSLKDARTKTKSTKGKALAKAMIHDLEKAAAVGGYTTGSLTSIWKHLIDNDGKWTGGYINENNVTAAGGAGAEGGYVIPQGILTFEAEMQKRAQKVAKGLQSIYGSKGVRQYQRELEAYQTNEDWKKIGKRMDQISKVLEKLPEAWAFMICSPRATDMKYLRVTKSWLTLGAYAYKGANMYLNSDLVKGKSSDTEKFAAVAAFVIETAVPHFGSAYGEVIKGVPNAMKFMAKHRKRMNDAIALGAR